MKKVMVLITDGVGIRNFIHTSFLKQLSKQMSVTIAHPFPSSINQQWSSLLPKQVNLVRLPVYKERKYEQYLRETKTVSHVYRFFKGKQAKTILDLHIGRGMGVRKLIKWVEKSIGRSTQGKKGVAWLEKLHKKAVKSSAYYEEYVQFLKQERPDLVFCTHQRASAAAPLMVAARSEGIRTASFIFSWDNLPKSRMVIQADHFLVWSAFMKEEMKKYYPEVDQENVLVTGTTQFEAYKKGKKEADFFEEIQGDMNKPLICFSGDDVATSPFDEVFLEDVASTLLGFPEEQRPQLIFRRCPVDKSNRYDDVLRKFPWIKVRDPLWVDQGAGDWTGIVPLKEDVDELRRVVVNCDLVINVASTMAFDFALLDKPAVYLDYDPQPPSFWFKRNIYNMPHFDMVKKLDPLLWVKARKELFTQIHKILQNPEIKSIERKNWVKTLCQPPQEESGRRMVKAIQHIVGDD